MRVGDVIAFTLIAILFGAGVVILILAWFDRLPYPKPGEHREPTEFEQAAQDLSDAMYAVQIEVGKQMEPFVRKMNDAITRLMEAVGKSK